MKKIAFLLAASCLFFTCIDPVTLDIDTEQRSLVVDGVFTDSLGEQTVKISRSAIIGYGNDNILTPVPGCTVKVLDDAGNTFAFEEKDPGLYVRTMKGEPGRAYHVEISTPDGKHLRSEPSVLKPAPPIGEISTEVVESQFVNSAGNIDSEQRLLLKMGLSVADLPEKPFLRWRANGTYEFQESTLAARVCYVGSRPDLNNIKIFDTNTLANGELFDEPFLDMLLDYRFSRKYCFHVLQYAISEEEFKYWEDINDVVNIDGSLFDPPPGTVRGNIFNVDDPVEVVAGYFSVAGVRYERRFVTPDSLGLGFIEPKCGGFRPGRVRPPECSDCTVLGASSLDKPDYWQ